jgi:hypothetical protein
VGSVGGTEGRGRIWVQCRAQRGKMAAVAVRNEEMKTKSGRDTYSRLFGVELEDLDQSLAPSHVLSGGDTAF